MTMVKKKTTTATSKSKRKAAGRVPERPRKDRERAWLPPKAVRLLDELNSLEQTYGRGAQERKRNYKIPGEVQGRIAAILRLLEALNIRTRWDGRKWIVHAINELIDGIKTNGPSVMSDAERAVNCCQIDSFQIEPGTDVYDDSGGESHKRIKFTFTVKAGSDPHKCVLVNWAKGSCRDGNGNPFISTQQNVDTPIDFPRWTVDTVDEDPVYWSSGGTRWRYTHEGGDTYSARDDPGPALSSETGAVYAMKFRMCIYCIDDVPLKKIDHIILTKAIKCIEWQYSVRVAGNGTFSHPAL